MNISHLNLDMVCDMHILIWDFYCNNQQQVVRYIECAWHKMVSNINYRHLPACNISYTAQFQLNYATGIHKKVAIAFGTCSNMFPLNIEYGMAILFLLTSVKNIYKYACGNDDN